MTREFNFDAQLAMSQGVAHGEAIGEILKGAIPGVATVRRATQTEDRHGVDWWIELKSGVTVAVDVKVRSRDFAALTGEDDLALEIWSVVESRTLGWTLDAAKHTDYVMWWWRDTGRWCLVAFQMLRSVFTNNLTEWGSKYKHDTQGTDGRYHSECVYVPRALVHRAMYAQFGGKP